jgi:serine/threonine protein kinase/Tfp pilus assembly protein PilF
MKATTRRSSRKPSADILRTLSPSSQSSPSWSERLARPAIDDLEQRRVRLAVERALFRSTERLKLGRFELEERIGSGGMGVVYAARDPELDRAVALKVLQPNLAGREAYQRLLREAQSLAKLSHPNVVTVFEVGREGDRVFIAMELIDGDSLDVWLARAKPSWQITLRLMLEAARGIAAAHERGLTHRDIKPGNIVVDREDRPRVVDFGLARAELRAESVRAGALALALTQERALLGTPAYAAPEQLDGAEAGPRSDQFSFAVTLWEALTGKRPFSGDTVSDILAAIQNGKIEAEGAVRVPAAVLQALTPALRADPTERYPSMSALTAALSRASSPRSKVPAVVAVIVALSGLGALAAALTRTHSAAPSVPSTENRAAALREPRNGLRALALYEAPERTTQSTLSSVSLWSAAAEDFDSASQQPAAPKRWQAAGWFAKAEALRLKGELDAALSGFRRAVELDPNWALPHVALSDLASQRGDVDEALRDARRAQILDPDAVVAIVVAARAHVLAGQWRDAIVEYRRAIEKRRSAMTLGELALAYHGARMTEDAVSTANRALRMDPEQVSAHVLLAERALDARDAKTALHHASRAVASSPKSVPASLARADALAIAGKRTEALEAYRATLALWKSTRRRGAPGARLALVERALAQGTLPPQRGAAPGRAKSGFEALFGSTDALGAAAGASPDLSTTKTGSATQGTPGSGVQRPKTDDR